jgi:hypothetical protein
VIDVLRKLSAVLVALIAVAGAVIYGFVTSKLHNYALNTERATIINDVPDACMCVIASTDLHPLHLFPFTEAASIQTARPNCLVLF